MSSEALFFIGMAAVLAFWAGSTWRHTTRSWTDTRTAKVNWKKFRQTRWVAFKAAAIAVFATAAYLIGTGAIGLANVRVPPLHATVAPSTPSPSHHR